MNLLHFLGVHWPLTLACVLILAAIVAFAVLQPVLAAGVWQRILASRAGRDVLFAIGVLALVAALLAAFAGHFEAKGAAEQGAEDAKALTRAANSLDEAYASLRAASEALRAQNDEAVREIAHAKQAQLDADAAAKVALQAQDAAQRRMRAFDRDLQNARANPSCDALLRANVLKECGL